MIRYSSAALLAIASPALAQTTTECQTTGNTTRCTTDTPPPPLDYGKALRQGQDLVRPVPRPQAQPIIPHSPPIEEGGPDYGYNFFLTGDDLRRSCSSPMLSREYLACAAMVHGVSSTLAGAHYINGGRKILCVPKGVVLMDLIATVRKGLGALKNAETDDGPVLVSFILTSSYPCESASSQK